MLLVGLNYHFECDWFVELSDNKLSDSKLSDNNLASELVGKGKFFKPITIEEIVIFFIKHIIINNNNKKNKQTSRQSVLCGSEVQKSFLTHSLLFILQCKFSRCQIIWLFFFSRKLYLLWLIGNRTSCSPIRSVIILVIPILL